MSSITIYYSSDIQKDEDNTPQTFLLDDRPIDIADGKHVTRIEYNP
jgi:hypothetical protein